MGRMGSIGLAVTGLAVAGLVGAIIARAATQDTSQITACVEAKTGYLYLAKSCAGSSLTWSQAGPQGATGAPGPAGPPGPPGPAFHLAVVDAAAFQRIEQDLSGANALLAGLDRSIKAGSGGTAAYRRQIAALELRLHRARTSPAALAPGVGDALGTLDELGQLEALRLQMAMDRLSKLEATLSNILKKIEDTAQSITQNIK